MARKGITQAQVFNAADAISSTGQNPTVASVRAKLGTGSFTTITAHLRAWKEQVVTSAPEERAELRAELKAADARIKEQSDLLRRLMPEKKTGPATKRKPRPNAEPVTDTATKPLEL